ncbi:HSP20-like chaperone [Jaminaea rosea]|uniref:HSP20-like chaperone n=1 Tax=Jaminaea rosea TaxID=1569628 RepID=A0A316UST0_9BASI|nr:HSP20-like chaperone [Jaminaea rosea]PWN28359.1 HSP20-like chaperone [Jaminaea rosea]
MSYNTPFTRAPSILELMFTSPLSGPSGPHRDDGTIFVYDNAHDVEEAAARQHRHIEQQRRDQHRELEQRKKHEQQQGSKHSTVAKGQGSGQHAGHHQTLAQQQQQQKRQAAATWPYHPFFSHPLFNANDYGNGVFGGPLLTGPLLPNHSALATAAKVPTLSHSTLSSFSPRIDVHEDENKFQLSAELPGMPCDAVKVHVDDEGRTISIEGEMRKEYDSRDLASAKKSSSKGGDNASEATSSSTSSDKQAQPRIHGHVTERLYGHFSRSLWLPESAELDKISASFKDGLLRINVPKKETKKNGEGEEKEEVKKRKVTIEEVQE